MNKDEKEQKLDAIKSELGQKVEKIMGPIPENANTTNGDIPERYRPKTKDQTDPSSAPLVKDSDTVGKPADVPSPKKADDNETPDDKSDEMDKAVDDIAEKEADDVLAADDEAVKSEQKEKKQGPLKRFWKNKIARRIFIAVVLLTLAFLALYPTTRYAILNQAGVRSKASLTVIDNSTQQPLKNVNVWIGEATATTNDDGFAQLEQVKLGTQSLVVERKAFEKSESEVTIGWGSNPLPNTPLTPTGLQYAFEIVDFLSGKPINKAEVYNDDASAFSDKEGKALLTLDTKDDSQIVIKVKADGYREEVIKDDGTGDTQARVVKMVASQKQLFISKRSGKYDVYKIDADGKNEDLVLSGTGSERSDMTLATQPTGNMAALVSTRDNIRNSDGILLSTLTLIEIESNKTQPIDTSERIQIVGWIGNNLVYVIVDDSETKNGVSTHKLISYDVGSETKTEIVSGLFLNDVTVAGDRIYYAPSAELEDNPDSDQPKAKVKEGSLGLFSTNSSGGDKKTISNHEIWSIARSDYDTLTLGAGQNWYEHKLGTNEISKLSGAPAEQTSRIYVNSSDGRKSLWVDKRDGKGVLLQYSISKKEDKVLLASSGLSNPVRWLNSTTAVYRVESGQETADYVISTAGGDAKKLIDVTSTSGVENWYYY